ncbi:MAG TPA: glycosyltransferase family 4 protein [Polyangia bacterium]|nr:glycosyltransferase family 4 protein [Polyangia bacterium]
MLTADAGGNSNSLPPENGAAVWLVLDLAPKKRGSMEAQLVSLGARLTAAGARPTFVFSRPAPAWLEASFVASGVETRVLDFRRPAAAAMAFSRMMEAARPALVHFHFVRAYSPLVAMAKAVGARVILHDHITLGQPSKPDHPRRPAAALLLARGYKRARAAALNGFVNRRIAVSRFVADSVQCAEFVADDKLTVIENGIELSRYGTGDGASLRAELRAEGRKVVACVSRLAPEKGIDVLIRVMARVGRDALLLLAGDGPDVEACRALARAIGLHDHVRFLGLRDDVERVLAAADVVVMPSLWDEAFGLVVVEAMAAARAVVVTASGAMPELVAGGCGVVVPKRDEVAMAGAIGRLLDDDAARTRLGQAAHAHAITRFGLSTWVERIMEQYAALVPMLGGGGKTSGGSVRRAA